MASRTRYVHPERMVAHLWANQAQSEARNPRNTFYFRDSTIYSYGPHFPIAKFVTNKKGQRAVLFTTDTYSVTTAKHIKIVHGALHGLDLPVFNVNRLDIGASFAKEAYLRRIAASMEKAAKARLYAESHLRQAQHVAAEAIAYSKFFGLRWRINIPVFSEEVLLEIRAKLKAHREGEAERRKLAIAKQERQRIERLEKEAEAREEWLAGVDNNYGSGYGQETLLRVFGDEVQTSRGASVPVEHARKVWPHVLKCQAEGREFVANGHTIKVGSFEIGRIEKSGDIRAGCHYIKFDQVQKIARHLGLLEGGA